MIYTYPSVYTVNYGVLAKVKFCQIKEKYNEEIDCNHLNKVNLLS